MMMDLTLTTYLWVPVWQVTGTHKLSSPCRCLQDPLSAHLLGPLKKNVPAFLFFAFRCLPSWFAGQALVCRGGNEAPTAGGFGSPFWLVPIIQKGTLDQKRGKSQTCCASYYVTIIISQNHASVKNRVLEDVGTRLQKGPFSAEPWLLKKE